MEAASSKNSATKRYAVVTGSNKGIGFAICKQLAANAITVVLTARNEQRGIEAVERLKGFGLSDYVIFHQLDVTDPSSVSSLADFIHTHFGRLDILVNNAGVSGYTVDRDSGSDDGTGRSQEHWRKTKIYRHDLAVECLQINYYGVKRMVETFIPLLQLSSSPRIVNVSSILGNLKHSLLPLFHNIRNEWARGVLSDAESLTEERVDEVVNEFLKDFKEGNHKDKGWPTSTPAYIMSKAALNAYTRITARRYPTFQINSVCPGFVKTDLNYNNGILSVEEGAESPVRLCLMPDDGPSGLFFDRKQVSTF